MTATTASPQAGRASPLIWLGLGAVALLVLLLAFAGNEPPNIGGVGDPDGLGPDGLLAARLFIEESGGDTIREVGVPDPGIDVAILSNPNVSEPFSFDESVELVQSWKPMLDWVRNGGTLLTSLNVPEGPESSRQFVSDNDDDLLTEQGSCTIPELGGVEQLRTPSHTLLTATGGWCFGFGDSEEAFVVIENLGDGRIVRVATMAVFYNQFLDDADNAALFARLIQINDQPTVGFVPEAPIWFALEDDGEHDLGEVASGEGDGDGAGAGQGSAGTEFGERSGGGPLDSDGNPLGQDDKTLFELIDPAVLALIAGLAAAAALYAISKARRLGSPVVEAVPIELPSSSYVEAVGRLYHGTQDATGRSAAILRHDLRSDLARRVGMSADSSASDLATALVATDQQAAVVSLLDGPAPQTDEQFVALATQLIETRDRVERGGVATLAQSEDIAFLKTPSSERTSQ